ncbi:MAC/Perforin domain-containing protein [Penicillium alfredii]|uniref:MAC/Perforin domain-containing protein n=1 Tax=Penicillium alfredii TaxID=1506179 RepID=A0A9W9K8H7_9EURO|nr:MAC/Perforin domain-containing protein [Penicillium alfredii]KAJ5096391.1 MAC/Perforin domain-containing protein [Penicillium alfredii]
MDLKKSTVVKLSTETYPVQFGDGKIYKLPKNTKSSQGHRVTHTNSLKVARGAELAYELGTEASISGSYAGFSASASAQYSYSGSMSVNKIYAILSVNHTSFTLDLEGHEGTDKMVSAEFVAAAKRLPEWQVKKEIYNEYVQFFRNWGTHVIDSCTFGARYQLKVENSSVESKSKESFQAQVSAEYNGIGSVKGDASLKKSDEYANYLKTRVAQATVTGGSSGSGIILSDPPSDPEEYRKAFDAWANSLDKAFSTNLVNARINSIGHLLANSSIEEHRAVSSKLVKALDYLASMRVVSGLVKVLGESLET